MFPDDVKSPFLHPSTGAAVHGDQIDCRSENMNLFQIELKKQNARKSQEWHEKCISKLHCAEYCLTNLKQKSFATKKNIAEFQDWLRVISVFFGWNLG